MGSQYMENIILTNDERELFGLELISVKWDRVEIKKGIVVYFDGDAICKIIYNYEHSGEGFINTLYIEEDNLIKTRNREFVLPRTAKGKEKKLNYTSINGMKSTGCRFSLTLSTSGIGATLNVTNSQNSLRLPIPFPQQIGTVDAFRQWLATFVSSRDERYFSKVERMKNAPRKNVKYKNGDIFCYEIDLEYYGFALIIGQITKIKKAGVLKQEHIWNDLMTVPLIVRTYQFKSQEKNMPIEEIIQHSLSDSFFMMDDHVMRGVYEIIGNKLLTADDIDFPIQAGRSLSNDSFTRLCWGVGIKSHPNEHASMLPSGIQDMELLRHGVNFGVSFSEIKTVESRKTPLEKLAFAHFGISEDITFDDFNRQFGGMTREEYALYANKK